MKRVLAGLVAVAVVSLEPANVKAQTDVAKGKAQVETAKVTAERTKLRQAAVADGAVVATVTKGEELTILEISGGWLKVRTAKGIEGFVHSLFVSRSSSAAIGDVAGATAPGAPTGASGSAAPAASPADKKAAANVLNNARIIEMSRMKLPPEVIVARIKAGVSQFALEDQDLVALNKAGVAGTVIATMLESGVRTTTEVRAGGSVLTEKRLAQVNAGGFLNRVGAAATFGAITLKTRAFLQGPFSDAIVYPLAKIEIALPKGESIENYLLVRLRTRKDKREIEVGSFGMQAGGKVGLNSKEIVATEPVMHTEGRYELVLPNGLAAGEYMIYVLGSADFQKGILGVGYDFGVR